MLPYVSHFLHRYTPQSIDLEFKLKPFIPDFIPAVGDIDAFLKVNRKSCLMRYQGKSDARLRCVIAFQ